MLASGAQDRLRTRATGYGRPGRALARRSFFDARTRLPLGATARQEGAGAEDRGQRTEKMKAGHLFSFI